MTTNADDNLHQDSRLAEIEHALSHTASPVEKAALHLRLGIELEDRMLKSRALDQYQDAFRLDASSTEALQRARGIFREMGKLPMVAQLIDIELKSVKEPLRAVALLGQLSLILAELGEGERARECLRRALEIRPEHAATADALADLEIGSDWEARVRILVAQADVAGSTDPARAAELMVRAGRLGLRNGERSRSEAALRKAALCDPTDEDSTLPIEDHLAVANRREELWALHEQLLASAPDDASSAILCMRLATQWIVRHDDARRGIELCERLLSMPGAHKAAFFYLADRFEAEKDYARFLAIAEHAISRAPSDAEAAPWMSRAARVCYGQLGDTVRARSLLERLARIEPNHPEIAAFARATGETIRPA